LVLGNLGLLLAATDGDLFAGDQTVNLVNRNSAAIDFTVQTAPDWVVVTPSAGTVPANCSLALDVTGATDSLSSLLAHGQGHPGLTASRVERQPNLDDLHLRCPWSHVDHSQT
jgi:hypothetical protein